MSFAAFTNAISNVHSFSPPKSIPDLSEKVILVTGGNAGVGLESIVQLVQYGRPARIYMGARSQEKYDIAMRYARQKWSEAGLDTSKLDTLSKSVHWLPLDLASFSSVKSAADILISQSDRLDILLNNAGVMALPAGTTKEGYEIQFGTNHMGHALLTKLLMPLLISTASSHHTNNVRIINLTSMAAAMAPPSGISFGDLKTDMSNTRTYARYGQSKLANILFTKGLQKHYGPQNIVSVAIHPGRVQTQLLDTFFGTPKPNSSDQKTCKSSTGDPMYYFQRFYDWMFIMTPDKGAWNQVWACTAPEPQLKNGAVYVPCGKELSINAKYSEDEKLAAKLWEWQEEEFREHGY